LIIWKSNYTQIDLNKFRVPCCAEEEAAPKPRFYFSNEAKNKYDSLRENWSFIRTEDFGRVLKSYFAPHSHLLSMLASAYLWANFEYYTAILLKILLIVKYICRVTL